MEIEVLAFVPENSLLSAMVAGLGVAAVADTARLFRDSWNLGEKGFDLLGSASAGSDRDRGGGYVRYSLGVSVLARASGNSIPCSSAYCRRAMRTVPAIVALLGVYWPQ